MTAFGVISGLCKTDETGQAVVLQITVLILQFNGDLKKKRSQWLSAYAEYASNFVPVLF